MKWWSQDFDDVLRRIIKIVGSTVLLALSSPVFVLTALAVWGTDFGPVFYRQTRAGIFGRPFELLKFRSMRVNDRPLDRPEEIGERDPLVTEVGRVIRRLKVDELPQLINVLLGEMTWIGPRPTVLAQVESYTPFQRHRLDILPGMTGWAQVNGGSEISWTERILLEVWYVKHRSFFVDMKILWRTAVVILRGNKANHAVIEEALRYAEQHPDAVESDFTPFSGADLSVDAESQRLHQKPMHIRKILVKEHTS
jgi:lipopolysaccharide/colanic/teichoic acid biosynthesis glycosyltransferase